MKRKKNRVNSPATINEAVMYEEVISTVDYLADNCIECDAEYCRDLLKGFIKNLVKKEKGDYEEYVQTLEA